MSDNPFEPPVGERSPELDIDAWTERERLLPKESVARAASIPLLVVGLVFGLVGAYGLLGARQWTDFAQIGVALLHLTVGVGVRALRAWARMIAVGLSALGAVAASWYATRAPWMAPSLALLAMFLGVPGLILGNRAMTPVFTREYARIVQATPALRYRAPRHVWISFILLILGAGLVLVVELNHPRLR
ncbi:MAG: hypothetical protein U1E65_25460 [Myxococcota bacterium]